MISKTYAELEAGKITAVHDQKGYNLATSRARFQLLADALEQLAGSNARAAILDTMCIYARHLVGAAGASIVLRNDDLCYCMTEDTPASELGQGKVCPLVTFLSEWAMQHRETTIVVDVAKDERIPDSLPKFIEAQSLVIVPVGPDQPFAAIGAYWSQRRDPDPEEIAVLETLAKASGAALERHAAEEALRASEQRFRGIAELSPDGILINLNDRFVYANPAALTHLGAHSIEELKERPVFDFILPQYHERSKQRIARTLAGLSNALAEIELRRLDGTIMQAEVAAAPVTWEGKPSTQVLIRDIAERKRTSEALKESEERLRTLVEGMAQAIWETDADGKAIGDSPCWRAYTGQTLEQWLQQGWLCAVHPDDRIHAEAQWRNALSTGERMDGEFRIRHSRTGEWRWVNVRVAPLRRPDGTVRKWVGMSIDITDRKQAEEKIRQSEEFHRITLEAGRIGTWNLDLETKMCTLSSRMAEMLGLSPKQERFPQAEWKEAIAAEDRQLLCAAMEKALKSHRMFELEFRVRHNDGVLRWLYACGAPFLDSQGQPVRVYGTAIDITEKKRIQEELHVTHERLQLAIDGAGEGVWDWDLKRNIGHYSARMKEILGYADHELTNETMQWYSRVHPEDLPRVQAALQECLEEKAPSYMCEYRVRCKDGHWKWVFSRGILVTRDADGKPQRITGMLTDISERKQADERVWRHANFDALTGLPNRRLFRDRLEQEVKKAHQGGHVIGLLFIDLDRFKEVNDLLGHDAGDLLLVQAAQRIKNCVREADTVARLGGDEFTIILAELENAEKVEYISQQILDALAKPFLIGNETTYVSGSIGITLYPEDATTPEELIRKADQAMYAAKHAGKNQFSYFTASMDQRAHLRLRLAAELRNALLSRQLQVYFQPVIDLNSGRIVKAEALLRWNHPEFGAVDPAQFIPLAEESGLINEIGDWVFREAASCAKRWSRQLGAPFQIGVNKSPIQFLTQEQDSWVDHLQSVGLSTENIAVEITEGMLLDTSNSVSRTLIEYRDAGIQVAIDDFGTGYSSMAYLKKFHIDYLKIDQSFVRDMTVDPANRTIAESIIVMAHKLGLKVIAEGVESLEQKEILQAAGCDYGQGYLFARPLAVAEFEKMLTGGGQVHAPQLH